MIGKGILNDGRIEIKCKCGVTNTIEAAPKQEPKPSGIINGSSGLTVGTFSIQHINS